MFAWFKRWWVERRFPLDPIFSKRPQSNVKFNNWVLVELGAAEYTMIHDLLHDIHRSDHDIETKGREVLGLRYMALAYSIRTRSGRIPINWAEQADQMWLASLPYSQVVPALQAVSELSDIPWLNPIQTAKTNDSQNLQEDDYEYSKEDIEANPS